jgi:hypothetical protein
VVSIRANENNIVTAYGEVIGDYNPFPDGLIIDADLNFFLDNFDTETIVYKDGTLEIDKSTQT